MSYNISNLKTDLQAILNTNDLSKITGINPIIERAARDVIADIDLYEMVRDAEIATPVHRDAYYYAAPTDMKGEGILDIYKNGDRPDDNIFFSMRTALDSRTKKEENSFTIERINGNHFIRINKSTENYFTFDNINSTTGFTAGSNVSDISLDGVNYINGAGSIKFNLDQVGSSTTATISKAIASAFDLTNYYQEGSVFIWVYMPDASGVTSIGIDIGSDSSNYWTMSATTTYAGTSFQNGWNLVRFNFTNRSETGTVDIDAVDYYAIDIAYDGTAQSGFRIDLLSVSLGVLYRVKYYSKHMFKRNSDSAWVDTIDSDSDTINLDTDSYNLLLYKAASYAIQHQHDFNYKSNASEADVFEVKYREAKKQYKRRYKSERIRRAVEYYPYSFNS